MSEMYFVYLITWIVLYDLKKEDLNDISKLAIISHLNILIWLS